MVKKIITTLGTRPEIIKLYPIIPLLDKHFTQVVVHTGQHYDYNMDLQFFEDLNLRKPDIYLHVGSSSHAKQTANAMVAFEEVLEKEQPDIVIVYGDTNSSLAVALTTIKYQIEHSKPLLVHIEAGFRSREFAPEEINRKLTDQISDVLFTPSDEDKDNLLSEGIDPKKIFIVGNTVHESCKKSLPAAKKRNTYKKLGLEKKSYVLLTMHRPPAVDDKNKLEELMACFDKIAEDIPVIFPVHPRTKKNIEKFNLKFNKVQMIEPQGYLDFLNLLNNAKIMLTDSGGVQDEAPLLNVPCLIMKYKTEMTRYILAGKNFLVGRDSEKILKQCSKLVKDEEYYRKVLSIKLPFILNTGKRIIDVLTKSDLAPKKTL
ncbi:MAG: UDP-N-acetylglucosamine 2-epimerase (non-hydrolyzing) [Candidatus Omnitrophota bacterium]